MAKQVINLGTTINDGTGDTLRLGAEKINENFTELYDALSTNNAISVVSSVSVGPGLVASNPSGPVTISVTPATQETLGSVKIGSGLSINETGVLSASTYTLPKAASNILGGVKVGDNLTINNEGVLSAVATPYTLPTASLTTKGGIKIGTGLEMVGDVLNVTTSEIAAALQSGDVTLQLIDDGDVTGRLKASGPLIVLAGGQESNDNYVQLQWTRDVNNPDLVKSSYIWLDTNGIHFQNNDPVGNELVDPYSYVLDFSNDGTLTFNSLGKVGAVQSPYGIDLYANSGMDWAQLNYDNTNFFWVDQLGSHASVGPNVWDFRQDKSTLFPGSLIITGDTELIIQEIQGLQENIASLEEQIGVLDLQIANTTDQIEYWNNEANSASPGSPQQQNAISQIGFYQNQLSSQQSNKSALQDQLLELQGQLVEQQALLLNANVSISYNATDEALELEKGGIKFPDGTIQTTAFLGVSPPEITVDSLDNGSYSVNLNSNGSLTIPGNINSTSIFTIEAVTDINATAGEDVVITSSIGFALRNYSTTDGISIITAFNDETESVWEFKTNGNLQLPAGGAIVDSNGNPLVQEGFKVVTAPTTSKGYSGNILGDIAFTSGNFYYCTGTYDGTTDIWVKTAWATTGTWTEEGPGGGIE